MIARRATFYGLAVALVALGVLPQFLSRTIPDTAWLLYSAARIADGARLYVDLVDVNPPLIFWIGVLPVLVARAFDLDPIFVYRVLVLLVALCSTVACGRLLRRYVIPDHPALWRYLLLLILFALVPLSRADYGEREHLMLALALPYILLTVPRARGESIEYPVALAAGVAAGIGIGLKPYFVLLWLALEGCLLLQLRRRWRPRVESVAVVAVGIAYLLAVVSWAPEYLDVVRAMGGPYYTFLQNSLPVTALLGEGAALPLFAMASYAALRRSAQRRVLWTVLFAAVVGFYASAVLQHKGWRYHYYPSLATGMLLLGLIAVNLRRPLRSCLEGMYAAVVLAVAGVVPLVTVVACVVQSLDPYNPRYDADPDVGRLIPVVKQHAAGGRAMVLSWSMASTFPLLTYAGVESASRFNHLWILGAAYWDQLTGEAPLRYRSPAEMDELERYLNDAVVEDLERGRPQVLLVLRPAPDQRPWRLRRLDFLEYFKRDPRFRRLFARYAYAGEVGEYWVFDRLPEGAPPAEARRKGANR